MITRLLLYNIYQGGEERTPIITRIVQNIRPTILGVLEANGWDTHVEERKNFAANVGLPFLYIAKANTAYNVALLSAPKPEKQYHENEDFWHTCLVTIYEFPRIGRIAIILLHLNPKTEDARVQEIKKIIDTIQPFEHVILLGDFNSLSPSDPYNRRELMRQLQRQHITKFGANELDFRVIHYLENHQLIDVMHALQKPFVPTVPTTFNQDKDHAIPVRLDYFFVSKNLTPFLLDAQVVRNSDTEMGSDHYPVYVDFEF